MDWKKLTSGRFILTLLSGGTFAYMSCTGMLPPEAVAAILASVFHQYFDKDRKPAQ